VQVAIAEQSRPQDIVVPGHVFPLRARDGGVLVRAGHTEAAVDLAQLAGLTPAGVICEIMQSDGTMARLGDLQTFAKQHGLLLASIADLIAWREARESLVQLVAEAEVATASGPFRAYAWANTLNGEHHLALVRGERLGPGRECPDPVLVRVQQEAVLADVFTAVPQRIDLRHCLARIAEAGEGVLLVVNDVANRSLPSQLVALGGTDHRPQPRAAGTMDLREYGIGAQVLHALGVRKMRLLTGSDRPITALSGHGLEVVERVRP
jgi:3,4-dihydroxy 2-butanone 4-phosphate synthase/GTP cyclohydrolase II